MDYQHYTAEDFVLDSRFRRWVLDSDQETHRFWEGWIARHPDKVSLLKEARMLLLHLPQEKHRLNPLEVDEMWNAIDREADEQTRRVAAERHVIPLHAEAVLQRYEEASHGHSPHGHGTREYDHTKMWDYTRVGRVAASVLIVFALGLSYFLAKTNKPLPLPETKWVVKENPWGQRSITYLSDGTEVQLNVGSRIEYEEKFMGQERVVMLEGEAFFEVSWDEHRPFRVVAAGLVTEALGTSFNVNAYDPLKVEVALVTGKVRVKQQEKKKDKAGITLNPGEGVSYRAEQGLTKYYFDPQNTLSWKEGIIHFKNADEHTVFMTLERWYGIRFQKTNRSPKPWNYTASYQKKSLEHILLSMSFAMGFTYEMHQKEIKITYQ